MAHVRNYLRPLASQLVSYAAAGGSSAASTAFGAQTYFVRVLATGVVSATLDGVRVQFGDGTPTASSTSMLVALNYPETFAVTPGQKVAVLGNNTGTGTVSITEMAP
jgi:hypothetical protein